MLIVALVLAIIGLAALVTAVVTSNELIAWVCIAASVIGVLLLIVDALRERSRAGTSDVADGDSGADDHTTALEQAEPAEDYPEEPVRETASESSAHTEAVDQARDDSPPKTSTERL
jgi:hypothetical protein